ncbi:hypothetical protein ACVLD2_002599 [Paenibacillus sp. PvR052]
MRMKHRHDAICKKLHRDRKVSVELFYEMKAVLFYTAVSLLMTMMAAPVTSASSPKEPRLNTT